jgi:hypothetical protein
MALTLTLVGNKSARIACTGCTACLVVSGLSSLTLRLLVAQMEPDHSCSASC